jgi:6-phosphofructokinase 2
MTIATLTLNPTIDVAYEVDRMFHTRKMRTNKEFYDPGGGGINVARVFVRLGGDCRSFYMSGGATGQALDGLLDLHQLVRTRVSIAGETRVSSAVLELDSGKEYRFVPPGPVIYDHEWQDCLARLGEARCGLLVISGSLPPGVPDDFYGRVIEAMRARDIPVVLDSSGRGLAGGLAAGGVLLVKPSIGELRQLTGEALEDQDAIAEAAMALVRARQARHVAVTLGHEGALLANEEGVRFLRAPKVDAKSAVGAGDSFVAAMVFGLTSNWTAEKAFRYGMAAGAAAVLSPGHDLARPADIDRLFQEVPLFA